MWVFLRKLFCPFVLFVNQNDLFIFRWGEERNFDGTSKKYWVSLFICYAKYIFLALMQNPKHAPCI